MPRGEVVTPADRKKNMMDWLIERIEFAMLQGGLNLQDVQEATLAAEGRIRDA